MCRRCSPKAQPFPDVGLMLFTQGNRQTPWRGSLLPLGREAAPKPAKCGASDTPHPPVYDCFAAEREQAPSPQ
ncbi:hypothetical protein SAMN03159307_05866, partial [Pseudomonas sp. NFACC46-3]